MAMEISSNYSSYASGYAGAADSRKKAAATQTGSIGESGLSQKAQALLEKLRDRKSTRLNSSHDN